MSLILLAIACTTDTDDTGSDTTTPGGTEDTDLPAPVLELGLDVNPAFDPLRGPLDVGGVTTAGASLTVSATWAGGSRTLFDGEAADAVVASWDGKDDGGQWAPAGAAMIVAVADLDGNHVEASYPTAIVRPAFHEARLLDDDGVTSLRVPLYFPGGQELQDEAEPVALLDPIEEAGVALDFPAPDRTELHRRPAPAEPAAYRYDSQPLLELTPAEVSPGFGTTGLDVVPVDVTAAGWTVVSGSPLASGVSLVLRRDAQLGDTVGVTIEDVALSFSTGGLALGEQHLPLHVYRVLDESQFDAPEARYRPWAIVVDQAMTAIDGTAATTDDVLDALVDFVYLDLGLEYDTVAGASFYSVYAQGLFDAPHFYLSDFLVRQDGNVVNCSDAGNILGAYANLVGARLDHLIIEPGFDLNFIQAIGYGVFTSCPFGPNSCGFSYHAVTTYTDSFRIWDATLALDGDDDPGMQPHTELIVQGVDAAEYLDRLVRAGFTEYGHQAQETLE